MKWVKGKMDNVYRPVSGGQSPASGLYQEFGGIVKGIAVKLLFLMTLTAIDAQHIVPVSIQDEARIALSHYPQLRDTPITFKFKKNIRKSVMLAQPDLWSLFRPRDKRKYKVLINQEVRISDKSFTTRDIPKDVLIGWLGHELGHIMDYKRRSSINLLWFGFRYKFSGGYLKIAERTADAYAVTNGMEDYIIKTKEFILNHAKIGEPYKNRIRKYYLSPTEILLLVEERDEDGKSEGL